MTRRAAKPWRPPVRRYRFIWSDHWAWADVREDEVTDVVELNPGILRVEDMQGNVVWRPN